MPNLNDLSGIMTSLIAYEAANQELKVNFVAMQNSKFPGWVKEKAFKAWATLRRNTIIGAIFIVLVVLTMTFAGMFLLFSENDADADLSFTLLMSAIPVGIALSLIGIVLGRNAKSAKTWRHYARFVALGVDAYPIEELETIQTDVAAESKLRTIRGWNFFFAAVLVIALVVTAIFLWPDNQGLFTLIAVVYCVIYFVYDLIAHHKLLQIERQSFVQNLKHYLEQASKS